MFVAGDFFLVFWGIGGGVCREVGICGWFVVLGVWNLGEKFVWDFGGKRGE